MTGLSLSRMSIFSLTGVSSPLQFCVASAAGMLWWYWHRRWPVTASICLILAMVYSVVDDAVHHRWGWVAADVVLIAFWCWRLRDEWRKRKRRRLLQKLGYKALALRAKLADTLKRERQPRRVLRPSPVPS